jgi:prevent-host-death family protein
MGKKYSLYEAKTKLSALVRQVREGGAPVTITVHGQPAVEIRAISTESRVLSVEEKVAEMERDGYVHFVPVPRGGKRMPAGPRNKGALEQFLRDR